LRIDTTERTLTWLSGLQGARSDWDTSALPANEIADTSPSSGCRHLLPARGAKGPYRDLSVPIYV
ncbi:hypothetical protein ACC741_37405, partial [Rhizobium johnstonii]|uniref:hypothetical protein n=1 Tax=Rhizobium johnstonii TaxID=3019933 RepID=UPI003F9E7F1E